MEMIKTVYGLLYTLILAGCLIWELPRINKRWSPFPDDERANECIRFLLKVHKKSLKWRTTDGVNGFPELNEAFYLTENLLTSPSLRKNPENRSSIRSVLHRYAKDVMEVYILWDTLPKLPKLSAGDIQMVVNRTRYVLDGICHSITERVGNKPLLGHIEDKNASWNVKGK
jgi:hypothetical protein